MNPFSWFLLLALDQQSRCRLPWRLQAEVLLEVIIGDLKTFKTFPVEENISFDFFRVTFKWDAAMWGFKGYKPLEQFLGPQPWAATTFRKTVFLWKQNMPYSWVTYASFVPGLIDITTDRVLHLRMSSSRVGHIDQSTARQNPPGKDYDLLYCSCFRKDIQTCQLGLEIKQYIWHGTNSFIFFKRTPKVRVVFVPSLLDIVQCLPSVELLVPSYASQIGKPSSNYSVLFGVANLAASWRARLARWVPGSRGRECLDTAEYLQTIFYCEISIENQSDWWQPSCLVKLWGAKWWYSTPVWCWKLVPQQQPSENSVSTRLCAVTSFFVS